MSHVTHSPCRCTHSHKEELGEADGPPKWPLNLGVDFRTALPSREACTAQTHKHLAHGIKNLNSIQLVCLRDHWLALNTVRQLALAKMLVLAA